MPPVFNGSFTFHSDMYDYLKQSHLLIKYLDHTELNFMEKIPSLWVPLIVGIKPNMVQ